ncbi:MAG: hypothetical protein ABSF80_05290 [Chitinispirillaceae bacterium]
MQKEDIPRFLASLSPEHGYTTVAACGDVRISIDGEMHKGTIEVHWHNNGCFNADFYGPFGVIAGSIKGTESGGTVTLAEGQYKFAFTQTMDSLPFAWGKDLTFGDMVMVLLGRMPSAYAARMQLSPDSYSYDRKTISGLWKTDTLDIHAIIRNRAERQSRVMFVFKKHLPFWYLTFQSFKQGRAFKIEFRENDRNYFSIKYTKVKCN